MGGRWCGRHVVCTHQQKGNIHRPLNQQTRKWVPQMIEKTKNKREKGGGERERETRSTVSHLNNISGIKEHLAFEGNSM